MRTIIDDHVIERLVKKHYYGNVESLTGKMLVRIAKEVANEIDYLTDKLYFDILNEKNMRIEELRNEIALLKGEEPDPPRAIA